MSPKSFLNKFFLGGEILVEVNSPINGEIVVREDLFGRREMIVGRVAQSGGLVEELWRRALNFPFSASEVLILGLGAGTLAEIINQKFPQAKITGVEIDPTVVTLGKKYFGLNEVKQLKVIVGDAFKEVRNWQDKFDLVLVDLYLGQEFPEKAEEGEFLHRLKTLTRKNGQVIFNRLYYRQPHQEKADQFLAKVKAVFPRVETKKVVTNLLILASF